MPFTSDGPSTAIFWMPLARTGNPWLTIRSSWRSSTSASSGSSLTGSRPTSRAEYPRQLARNPMDLRANADEKTYRWPIFGQREGRVDQPKLCTPQPTRRSSWPYPDPGLKERRGKVLVARKKSGAYVSDLADRATHQDGFPTLKDWLRATTSFSSRRPAKA